MTTKTLIELTSEKLKEIYTNEKFRNEVAFAHTCLDINHKFKHKKTCDYPDEYIVTEEQIKEAEEERQRAKAETIEKNKNKLSKSL